MDKTTVTTEKPNERKNKRFGLNNALIGFPGEDNHWGKITDISRGGFKLLTNEVFKNGTILSVLIDLRNVPDQALFPNLFEIKIKIVWRYPLAPNHEGSNSYGVSFADLSTTEKEFINSLFESLDSSGKMGDKDIDTVLSEIDAYLEQFRK